MLWTFECCAVISNTVDNRGLFFCYHLLSSPALGHQRGKKTATTKKKSHQQDKRNLSGAAFIESLWVVCECVWIAAAELIYRWAFCAFNSSAGAPWPSSCGRQSCLLPRGGACVSSPPITAWSKGCLDVRRSDAPIKSPSVKTALPFSEKNEVRCRRHEMNPRLLPPKVLCSEGSRVWLRGLGSAAIYQSELGFRGWSVALLACGCLPRVGDTSSITPVDEIPALVSSLGSGLNGFTKMEDGERAAAGLTLNNASAHETRLKQHLSLRAV